jgi:chromosomal replication initiation ATPase DnaA
MLAVSNQRAEDASAYREIASEFYRVTASDPQRSRYIIARNAALRVFGITVTDALSDSRKQDISQFRMKAMATVAILTDGNRSAVGRVFNKWPTTINHAVAVFGDEINQALRTMKKPATISTGKTKADQAKGASNG